MPAGDTTAKESYRAHERAYDAYADGADRSAVARSWLDPATVNSWRMARMYRLADPVLEAFPGAHWLTVGDGRFGIDSQYLAARGAKALPTDISTTLLEEAKARGLIAEYRKENAERLSFADESFDFVLCKESYHHFPRPMVALYEMLRVARRGVLLIEPSDHEIADSAATVLSRLAKNLIKRVLRRPAGGHRFEALGNYVYGISRREIEKLALGAGYPAVAFRGINDYYRDGIEFEPAWPGSAAFREVRSRIARYDLLCRLGINQYGLLAALILRRLPEPGLEDALRRHGYDVVRLPARKSGASAVATAGCIGSHGE